MKNYRQHCICKMRADVGTSAAATLQVRFGAGPLTNKLIRYIQLYIFNLSSAPGGPSIKYPHFANADRVGEILITMNIDFKILDEFKFNRDIENSQSELQVYFNEAISLITKENCVEIHKPLFFYSLKFILDPFHRFIFAKSLRSFFMKKFSLRIAPEIDREISTLKRTVSTMNKVKKVHGN
jgi:hypothetical protein